MHSIKPAVDGTDSVLSRPDPSQLRRKCKPVPSLLRGFSAPVILNYPYTEADLVHLMANDDDPFNRWEAAQRLPRRHPPRGRAASPSAAFLRCHCARAREEATPPSSPRCSACPRRPSSPSRWRSSIRTRCTRRATRCAAPWRRASRNDFLSLIESRIQAPTRRTPPRRGKRALRNLALSYLMELETADVVALCYEQFGQADNMTDQFAALAALANSSAPQRQIALDSFYGRWKDEPLVVDKWLAVQAAARLPGTLARVNELLAHPAFDLKVPNKVYSLIRSFCGEPRALPRRRRRRLCLPRRPGDRAGHAQPAGGRAHGARLRPLEEVRRRPAGEARAAWSASATKGLSKDVAEIVEGAGVAPAARLSGRGGG